MKILRIDGQYATVESLDSQTSVINISLVEANLGDYVIANSGFAIRVMDEDEAIKTIRLLNQVEDFYKYEK